MEEIKYKKQYGQNFIYDTNLLRALVCDASVTKNDEVLEIGVGVGSLTKCLCEKAKKVVCYEIDESLKERIYSNLESFDNFEINFKDIMNVDSEEINNKFENSFKIVANLPYYITSPIIFKFLEGNYKLESLAIMVQKEVADRICSKENSKDYGILSVMIQSQADVKVVRNINRNMFMPVPNVDSSFVLININKSKFNILNKEKYRKFISKCFSMRRKTLLNNLKDYCNKDILINALKNLNLSENVRSEQISVDTFVKIFTCLSSQKSE